jgi:hypothetical protein
MQETQKIDEFESVCDLSIKILSATTFGAVNSNRNISKLHKPGVLKIWIKQPPKINA